MEQDITCPICGVEYDENDVCDVHCMARVTAEDDQIRAEVAEILSTTEPEPLTQAQQDWLTLLLYRLRLRGR